MLIIGFCYTEGMYVRAEHQNVRRVLSPHFAPAGRKTSADLPDTVFFFTFCRKSKNTTMVRRDISVIPYAVSFLFPTQAQHGNVITLLAAVCIGLNGIKDSI